MASCNLRELIDCILRDTAEDLRLQCDAVNLAFGRRLEELEDARHKLEHHLHKVQTDAPKPHPWPCPEQPGVLGARNHRDTSPYSGYYGLVTTWPRSCPSSCPPILGNLRGRAPLTKPVKN